VANICANHCTFFVKEDCEVGKEALSRLFNTLSAVMKTPSEVSNGYEPGWLGKVAMAHGMNWEKISCRGSIEYLSEYEPGDCNFSLQADTAWSPTDELRDAVVALYEGVSYVYTAEESGNGVFINSDTEGRFYSERYMLDIWGDGEVPEGWFADEGESKPKYLSVREYFSDFEELINFCTKLTGDDLSHVDSPEALQEYFSGIFEGVDRYANINEFEAA